MVFNCGECHKCEEMLNGSFFPGEEWKLQYFKDSELFKREGVWFLGRCQYFKDGKCMVHDEPWRPIQCQIYPCYLNYDGSIGVDYEGCPKAKDVDDEFLSKVKALVDGLKLQPKQLRRWLKVVSKYNMVENNEEAGVSRQKKI